MGDHKRGDDAADHLPKPVPNDGKTPKRTSGDGKQDAPNYAEREDGGRAVPAENINSANDE